MLVEAKDLTKEYVTAAGKVRAVDGVSFTLERGQTLGLVGESGSGKSTVARLISRLQEPTSGSIFFEGTDLLAAGEKQLRALRRRMQMVFQDPYNSLLPHYTVAANVAEPMALYGMGDARSRRAEAERLLDLVGVSPRAADLYPHEFSGGQQQRIAIARALSLKPDLLICDEPVSSLDVSVQAQILNLFQDLQKQMGLAYLFISHNLAVVEHLSSHVAVMYLGRLVEVAPRLELYGQPTHPYTRALLSAVLPVRAPHREVIHLEGDVPSPLHPPAGCRFHPRCPYVEQRCRVEDPAPREVAPGHVVACHLA